LERLPKSRILKKAGVVFELDEFSGLEGYVLVEAVDECPNYRYQYECYYKECKWQQECI
jgi:hypothetical protein